MEFTDKVVVITGASSGIGEASALAFARLSARLVLVGRNAANLHRVAEQCEQLGGTPLAVVADVTNEADVERIVRETLQRWGRVDVLVNNAGAGLRESILNPSLKTFDDTFNLNVRAVYHLTSLLAPALIQTKGSVVNVSSIASTWPNHLGLTYCMSKAALDHFTRLCARELAPRGVRVNAVNPGFTATNFQATMLGDAEKGKSLLESYKSSIPLGEVAAPSEIADAVVYLASDKAKSITGTNLVVDGGFLLH